MNFPFNEINYVTVIKQYFPQIAISKYMNPNDYNTFEFNLNGANQPTKEELDTIIAQLQTNNFTQNVGQALNTSFVMVGQMAGNSLMTFDNTIPLITEGTEICFFNTIPVSQFSKFSFSATFLVDTNSNNKNISVALFRNSVCFYSNTTSIPNAGKGLNLNIEAFDAPGISTPIRYSVRLGINTAATWYLNQSNTGFSNAGTTSTPLRISEYS